MTTPAAKPGGSLVALFADTANLRGMAWMTASGLFFASNFGLIRHLSAEFHAFELVFFRSLIGFFILLPVVIRHASGNFMPKRPGILSIRALAQLFGMFCWYAGLAATPLATATALGMLEPIFAALFAIFFLGERSEVARWFAAALGFAGMLIILRPGVADVDFNSAILVAAAMFWGISVITGKVLTRTESVAVVVAYPAALAVPIALAASWADWVWPQPEQYIWLVGMGLMSVLGSVCIARAYKVGDVTAVSPFTFMRMVFAAIIGFVVFTEVPVVWTWVGGALIAVAGTYLARREAQAGRARKAAAAAQAAEAAEAAKGAAAE